MSTLMEQLALKQLEKYLAQLQALQPLPEASEVRTDAEQQAWMLQSQKIQDIMHLAQLAARERTLIVWASAKTKQDADKGSVIAQQVYHGLFRNTELLKKAVSTPERHQEFITLILGIPK